MKRPARVGVFGGTFDPVHAGHIKAAEDVRRRFGLDRVLFVPANIPPHKARAGTAPARDRMAMVELALRGRRRLVPSALEVRAGGTSYSIRTLRRVKRLFPGARVFFIVGADAFLEIETWKDWRTLLDEGLFIVVTRPGASLRAARRAPGEAYAGRTRAVRRGERIAEDAFSPGRIFLLPIEALPVSATDIRARIRAGRSIAGLVPASVARYIRERDLYGGGPGFRPGLKFRRTPPRLSSAEECRHQNFTRG